MIFSDVSVDENATTESPESDQEETEWEEEEDWDSKFKIEENLKKFWNYLSSFIQLLTKCGGYLLIFIEKKIKFQLFFISPTILMSCYSSGGKILL